MVGHKRGDWVVHPDLRRPNKVWETEEYVDLASVGTGNPCSYNQAHVAVAVGGCCLTESCKVSCMGYGPLGMQGQGGFG